MLGWQATPAHRRARKMDQAWIDQNGREQYSSIYRTIRKDNEVPDATSHKRGAVIAEGDNMDQALPDGQRVVVTEFADNPLQALESFVRIMPMPAPSISELKPHEVLIGIKSAAVSWVEMLMTSGQYQHMPSPP